MKIYRKTVACVFAAVMTSAAQAAPVMTYDFESSALRATATPPEGEHLTDGRITLPPKAFEAFCGTYSDQCTRRGDSDEVALDSTAWSALRDVNRDVNSSIVARDDTPGADKWDLNTKFGDCDEYALEKRRQLLERGWPSAALSLAAAYIQSGQAHLVLTVRTSRGDFVLDNLRPNVIAADETGYRWIARQSALHPRLWVRVHGTTGMALAAAKVPATARTRASSLYDIGN